MHHYTSIYKCKKDDVPHYSYIIQTLFSHYTCRVMTEFKWNYYKIMHNFGDSGTVWKHIGNMTDDELLEAFGEFAEGKSNLKAKKFINELPTKVGEYAVLRASDKIEKKLDPLYHSNKDLVFEVPGYDDVLLNILPFKPRLLQIDKSDLSPIKNKEYELANDKSVVRMIFDGDKTFYVSHINNTVCKYILTSDEKWNEEKSDIAFDIDDGFNKMVHEGFKVNWSTDGVPKIFINAFKKWKKNGRTGPIFDEYILV